MFIDAWLRGELQCLLEFLLRKSTCPPLDVMFNELIASVVLVVELVQKVVRPALILPIEIIT